MATATQDVVFTRQRLTGLLTHPNAILRHDVDYDLACAAKMALYERRLGVQATYYLLPHGDYDVFSEHGEKLIRVIVACGGQLGCHVDLAATRASVFSDYDLFDACEDTYTLLAAVFPMTRKVAFHQPPRDVMWREVPGFESAQAPEWEGRYVADSRGVFRINPERLLARSDRPVMTNLHPEWWWWKPEVAAEWRQVEAAKP